MSAQGSVFVPANGTSFISKFCFTFNPSQQVGSSHDSELPQDARWRAYETAGAVEVTVWAPALKPDQSADLIVLDDQASSYPGLSGNWNGLTCDERFKHIKRSYSLNYNEVTQPTGQVIRFKIKEKLRPRWWYFALSDCSNATLAAQFQVHAVNPGYGWASEFSTDKRFVLFVFVPLAAMYACLGAVQRYANSVLADMAGMDDAQSKAAHPFARMLLAGIRLGFVAAILSVVHNVLYALHGRANPMIAVAERFMYVSSDFALASMLLLVSQGKCISYIMVAADGWKMLRLLGPFLLSCFLLELWGDCSLSSRYSVDYVYTTPVGWTLITVDLVLLGLYVSNLRKTYSREYDRGDGAFYRTWGVACGVWFLALPVMAVLSQAVLAPYVWLIVSLAVKKAVTVLAYTALVVGLWPGNRRTYFKLFVSKESVLENCVTPTSQYGQDDWQHHGHGPELDRFAFTTNSPQARLPTLLQGMRQARNGLSTAAKLDKL